MVRELVAALLLIACHAPNPAFCPESADPTGRCLATDAGLDPARECFGTPPFVICVTPPEAPRTLGRIDTTAGCDEVVTVGRELCVVKGTDIEIAQQVPVVGERPLVILASGALTIQAAGIVDAAATATAGGPGADLACDASATAGGGGASCCGGGGAGGTFGSRGGNGGNGGVTDGLGGTAAMPAAPPSVLQGGCSGTDGGAGVGGQPSRRGFGGGGVYLLAGETLTIHGTVTASGAGGRGGPAPRGGGGGAGSGGMIVLYAPTATATASAQIFANGGGGGGGAVTSIAGGDGETPTSPLIAAMGGEGRSGRGDGGDGAFLTTAAEVGLTSGDGGGGGGGGGGVIYILGGDFSAATLSPPPN
jgi:hypothetical protein